MPRSERTLKPAGLIGRLGAAAMALLLAGGAGAERQRDDIDVSVAIDAAVRRLLDMQEGDANAEWPYEGVYRVPSPTRKAMVIPIGYRVGGTSICAMALTLAPGYEDDARRRDAVERAAGFVVRSVDHPLMSHENIVGTYDVRGWGYTYGLTFLLHLQRRDLVPDAVSKDQIDHAVRFFIKGIEATEIPQSGGWNYARRGGFDQPGPMSPFMTAPTLLALYEAKRQGYDVDAALVERALDALERARLDSGAYVYSGTARRVNDRAKVPGAIGRMAAAELALRLAGRSSAADLRGAVDAFIVHWEWLDKRRAQHGTHVAPYGIAPYYFYFAHYYAAMAVEALPAQDRDEYRRRVRELIFDVRLEDGTWNDRVFKRSANYGTAMAMMTLRMPDAPPPAPWNADEQEIEK